MPLDPTWFEFTEEPTIAVMSILLLSLSPFSTAAPAAVTLGEADVGVDVLPVAEGIGLFPFPPPPALSTDFKSLDSTFSELPVESLVMVTEPPLPEEEGGKDDDDALELVGFEPMPAEAEEEVELGEDEEEVCLMRALAAKSLVTLLANIEEETDVDLTGEIVTLLLSFLCGELDPNIRPSSSSTLSNVDESIVLLLEVLSSLYLLLAILLSSLLLNPLVVRLLRSTKSLGFNNILPPPDSDKLGRCFLALGSSGPISNVWD